MLHNSIKEVPSFLAQAHILIPIIHNHLSGNAHNKIILSKSLSLQDALILPCEAPHLEGISVEEFLTLLDSRINKEFTYKNELLCLRNSICEEFNELCNNTHDEQEIKLIRDQRQKIIEKLLGAAKVDKKMIISAFFNDLFNGFEEEALNRFENIAYKTFWSPVMTPFPIKLLDEIKEIFEKSKISSVPNIVEDATQQIIQKIENHFSPKEIKSSEFQLEKNLRSALEAIRDERKVCNIVVDDHLCHHKLLTEFQSACINKVTLIIDSSFFAANKIPFIYKELILKKKIAESQIESVFTRVQKIIKTSKAKFFCKNSSHCIIIEQYLMKLKTLTCLNLSFIGDCVGPYWAKATSNALIELKCITNLHLYFNDNIIGFEGVKSLSIALDSLTNLLALTLSFGNNNIGAEGAKVLSNSLKKLKNVTLLSLDITYNEIGVEGATELSIALQELKNLSTLKFDIYDNNIQAKGAEAISSSLKQLTNISSLNLNLYWNNIGDMGVESISLSLKELTNITSLTLSLGANNITLKGLQTLSTVLKSFSNISTLFLHLGENDIKAEEIKIVSAALKNLTNISQLSLLLCFNTIGTEGAEALADALKHLKKISYLDLNIYGNMIKDKGLEMISEALKELTNISILDLMIGKNNIGLDGTIALSKTLADLKNLLTLNLKIQ